MQSTERVGVVGTGRMGAGIARRLHETGTPIAAVYDVNPHAAEEIASETGARRCEHLADVTASCEVVITVVTDDRAMDAIFGDARDSLLTADANGKYFINTATVTPDVHVEVQQRCEARGAHSIEACMASSIPQARAGTLYLMIGGRREDFEHLRPLLEKMSASMRYIGEAGRAAQVKALVNMVMNINTAALAEGLGLGEALGLDLTMLREVFSQTGAASRVLETDGGDMQNRDHDAYFSAEHAAKDSGIAVALAQHANLPLPLAKATHEQYERMKSLGLGGLDKSGISELTFLSRRAAEVARG